jgi:YhcH/YjgK/YiaL family protein
MKKLLFLAVALFLFTGVMNTLAQTTPKDMEKLMVQKWFEGKEWLGGLQLQPHQTINEMEFARQYKVNKAYWDKAFSFLKEHDLQKLANGKYPIDGDSVFAIVTENPTKDYDSTQWESHRGYIDLHCVISGEEKIGVYPITKLTVTKPYDASKDIANYSGEGKVYSAVPGVFFLFFPSDGHRPGITTGDKKADKKIVIKIRYAELSK